MVGTTVRREPRRAQRTQGKEQSLQRLEGTQGAPRKAVEEEAAGVKGINERPETIWF